MQYKVVYATSTVMKGAVTKIEKEVEELIKQGYSPQGGVSVSQNDSEWITVCQAMVKE